MMGCGASSSSTEAISSAQAKPEDKKSQAAENRAASQVDGQALPMLTGKPMPAIGLGTWQSPPGQVETAVYSAIEAGYRHIDTARVYMNEGEIGNALEKAIKDGKVTREDMFIVTKIFGPCMVPARVREQALVSLKLLKLDYLDLLLIHSPMVLSDENFDSDAKTMANFFPMNEKGLMLLPIDAMETYKEMEKLVDEGLVKALGVSNYNLEQMQKLWDESRIKPSNLQNECHAWKVEEEVIKFCKEKGITYSAFSPLGSPNRWGGQGKEVLMDDPTIVRIAKEHSRTPAQILLKYLLNNGLIVLPKSTNPERIKSNFQLFDFTLSEKDTEDMKAMNKNESIINMEDAFAAIAARMDQPNY